MSIEPWGQLSQTAHKYINPKYYQDYMQQRRRIYETLSHYSFNSSIFMRIRDLVQKGQQFQDIEYVIAIDMENRNRTSIHLINNLFYDSAKPKYNNRGGLLKVLYKDLKDKYIRQDLREEYITIVTEKESMLRKKILNIFATQVSAFRNSISHAGDPGNPQHILPNGMVLYLFMYAALENYTHIIWLADKQTPFPKLTSDAAIIQIDKYVARLVCKK